MPAEGKKKEKQLKDRIRKERFLLFERFENGTIQIWNTIIKKGEKTMLRWKMENSRSWTADDTLVQLS